MDFYDHVFAYLQVNGSAQPISNQMMQVLVKICRCSLEDDERGVENLSAVFQGIAKTGLGKLN